jgi:hypothetical protein
VLQDDRHLAVHQALGLEELCGEREEQRFLGLVRGGSRREGNSR